MLELRRVDTYYGNIQALWDVDLRVDQGEIVTLVESTTDHTDGTDMGDLIHEKLSEEIIGAAMAVLNELKPGLDEKLYENALVIELRERGHRIDQQKIFKVEFKGQEIGRLMPDLIIDEQVVVDAKVATAFNENHVAQMTGYLSKTGLHLALLINFKYAKLQWKRVVK